MTHHRLRHGAGREGRRNLLESRDGRLLPPVSSHCAAQSKRREVASRVGVERASTTSPCCQQRRGSRACEPSARGVRITQRLALCLRRRCRAVNNGNGPSTRHTARVIAVSSR